MFASLRAFGQNDAVRIAGFVVDSISGIPESYATMRVYKHGYKSAPVIQFVSDERGAFSATLPELGRYVLLVTSVGRKSVARHFEAHSSHTDLGTLLMSEHVAALEGLQVVAKKALVQVEDDKITYYVENDKAAATENMLDMLRRVPKIDVDAEGSIRLAGQNDFVVYVDGKPGNITRDALPDFLRNMSALLVKKVEVITNPGARYDAESVGGIINIVTSARLSEGYNLQLEGTALSNGYYSGSGMLSAKIKKFTFSAYYSYVWADMSGSEYSTDLRYKKNLGAYRVRGFKECPEAVWKTDNARLGMSYEMDSANLFSWGGSFVRQRTTDFEAEQTDAWDASGNALYGYRTTYDKFGKDIGGSFNFDYQHLFSRRKGEALVVSYCLDAHAKTRDWRNKLVEEFNHASFEQLFASDRSSLENTVQIDYVLPFRKLHKINFGAKYINRKNKNKTFRQFSDVEGQAWSFAGGSESDSLNIQRQQVLGIYGEYELHYKSFGLRGGIRYEYTKQKLHVEDGEVADLVTHSSDVLPSLSLFYNIREAQRLMFDYGVRVSRPGLGYLNPYKNTTSSPLYLFYGNPFLKSVRHRSLSVGYGIYSSDINLNIEAGYGFSNNDITRCSFADEHGTIHHTYANVGRSRVLSVYCDFGWHATDKMHLRMDGRVAYVFLSCAESAAKYMLAGTTNQGLSFDFYAHYDQRLPWRLELSAGGGVGKNAPQIYTLHAGIYHSYIISLSRAFFRGDRLRVSAVANMFAQARKGLTTVSETADYHIRYHISDPVRYYGLAVSIKLGDLKATVRKAGRSIHNSDVVDE